MTREEIESFQKILETLVEKSKQEFEANLADPNSSSYSKQRLHLYHIYRTTEEVLASIKKLASLSSS